MAMIKCKECGAEISNKAEKCPSCGVAGKKKTTLVTWIASAVFLIWFFGYVLGNKEETSSNTIAQQIDLNALPSYSASEMASAYDQNTVAADQQFKGKRFKVTGRVTDINTGITGKPYLVLSGGVNQFMNPQFEFDKDKTSELAKVSKGLAVSLSCIGKGDIAKTPMSGSCVLLD